MVSQISFIFSVLNLVLAASHIVMREIHASEVRGGKMVAAEDVAAMPEKLRELKAVSDRSTSPRSSSDEGASPQNSSPPDGSTSSGYPDLHLSSASSVSGNSWMLERPPRMNLYPPTSSHGSISPHPSSSVPSEIPSSPRPLGSDWAATTDSYSPSYRFTPSRHPSSISSTDAMLWHSDPAMSTPNSLASGVSLPLHVLSSDRFAPSHNSISEEFAPSHNSISEGLPSSPPPPPTEILPENKKFLDKNMIKKLKIVAGVVIISGIIASIAGSQTKHRDPKDR